MSPRNLQTKAIVPCLQDITCRWNFVIFSSFLSLKKLTNLIKIVNMNKMTLKRTPLTIISIIGKTKLFSLMSNMNLCTNFITINRNSSKIMMSMIIFLLLILFLTFLRYSSYYSEFNLILSSCSSNMKLKITNFFKAEKKVFTKLLTLIIFSSFC